MNLSKKFDGIFKGVSEIIDIGFLIFANMWTNHNIKNKNELYPLKIIASYFI